MCVSLFIPLKVLRRFLEKRAQNSYILPLTFPLTVYGFTIPSILLYNLLIFFTRTWLFFRLLPSSPSRPILSVLQTLSLFPILVSFPPHIFLPSLFLALLLCFSPFSPYPSALPLSISFLFFYLPILYSFLYPLLSLTSFFFLIHVPSLFYI